MVRFSTEVEINVLEDDESSEPNALNEFAAHDIHLPNASSTSLEKFKIAHGTMVHVYEVCIIANAEKKKRAALRKYNRSDEESLSFEADLLNNLSHRNIVKLFGVCYEDPYYGVLLELCEGLSLSNLLRRCKNSIEVPIKVQVNWAFQVAIGMEYIIENDILHKDLRAQNVLIKEPICYCADSEITTLEWCLTCKKRPINKLQMKISGFRNEPVSGSWESLCWSPPEVVKFGSSGCSEHSDVWSFGVFLWEIQELPKSPDYSNLKVMESWPERWREVTNHCWSVNPENRPTFWNIVQYFDEYSKILEEVYTSEHNEGDEEDVKKMGNGVEYEIDSKPQKAMHIKIHEPSSTSNTSKQNKSTTNCYRIAGITALVLFLIVGYMGYQQAQKSKCPDGFVLWKENKACYKVNITPIQYENATELCTSLNSNLISIHSKEESDFIMKIFMEKFKKENTKETLEVAIWLGMVFNNKVTKSWSWSDGTDIDYQSFDGTEIETKPNERWILTFNNQWRTANKLNITRASFICKKLYVK